MTYLASHYLTLLYRSVVARAGTKETVPPFAVERFCVKILTALFTGYFRHILCYELERAPLSDLYSDALRNDSYGTTTLS